MKKISTVIAVFFAITFLVTLFEVFAQDRENNIWTKTSDTLNPEELPLGDKRYDGYEPKKGYFYPCEPEIYYSQNLGSRKDGTWIHGDTWSMTEKLEEEGYVHGSVLWPNAKFDISTTADRRIFRGNGLPVGIPTGVFPVEKTDPAYEYDPNPNAVQEQEISYSVPLNPVIAEKPSCAELTIGITLDGVRLSSMLDSWGRDEIAHEIQDSCGGVTQPAGNPYHRHALSNCIPHINEKNALVGFAVDGFGIFSPYDENGKELVSADLDLCHGITSPIMWDGKKVNMYHYVLTRDFPYSITCLRGTPTRIPMAPPPFDPTNIGSYGRAIASFFGWIIRGTDTVVERVWGLF